MSLSTNQMLTRKQGWHSATALSYLSGQALESFKALAQGRGINCPKSSAVVAIDPSLQDPF